MSPQIFSEFIDGCVAAFRLLAQGHEHDIVEVAAKPLAQPVRRAFT